MQKEKAQGGILYGIGVGPGEPELLTHKAVQVIECCDTIVVPSEPIEECNAFQIVEKLVPDIRKHQLVAWNFPMTRDEKKLEEAHDKICESIEAYLAKGEKVAFLTLGDPAIYSTYTYLSQKIEEHGGHTEMVSGVPSFCAVAARLGISLGEKEEQIHIIPGSYEIEESRQFSGTRIYMKSGRKLKQLKEMLQKESTIRPLEVYSVSDCGKEEEKVFSGVDNIPENSGYFTIVIVKTKDGPVHNSSRFFENRACTYYPCHRGIEHINCMFCYCPMYEMEHCPGTPEYKETNGRKLKICTNCTYPHQAEHYDAIMKVLTHRLKG